MNDKLGKDIFAGELKRKIKINKEAREDSYIRKTFIVNSKYSDLIDRQAFWERRQIKDILNEILRGYYKDKNIKQYPK